MSLKRFSVLFATALCALPVAAGTASDEKMDEFIDDLMSKMTIEEKVGQITLVTYDRSFMTGETQSKGVAKKITEGKIGGVFNVRTLEDKINIQKLAVEQSRLGIPLMFGLDVIHGYRTIWPVPLALSCSWDMDLIERTASAAADEATSEGIDWTFSPMVDIVRDPRWGRVAESSGEDPYLGSRIAEAMVRGYQGEDLASPQSMMACVKHFALYGAGEGGRDYDMVDMSPNRMYQDFLPPYKAAVDAGAGSVMSSFNDVNGVPATANKWLLTDVLRGEWGFDGFTVSDYTSVGELTEHGLGTLAEVSARALKAGLDMDMVSEGIAGNLEYCLEKGLVSETDIDIACRRILEAKYKLGLFENPYTEEKPENERILLPASLEVAERAAVESMVLLKNDNNVLPLKSGQKIALIGPLARNQEDLLGSWFGRGRAEDVISIFDGLSEESGIEVSYAAGCDFDGDDKAGFQEAVNVASQADVVVLCLGEKRKWSGENASRSTIALPSIQEELLAELVKAGKPVVVLLSNGRSLDLTRISPAADAVLEIWQPGVMGGKAVAGILTGKYNPSGRLNVTFPYTTGQIPVYYNHRESGRRGSQGLYQDIPSTPMYEFGYGLSYTTYDYGEVTVSADRFTAEDRITAKVTVTNSGEMDGKETVQWYVCDPYSTITRPVKELKFFEKKLIPAGDSHTFEFEIDPMRDLSFVNGEGERFLEPGDYYIIVKDQKVKITLAD